MPRGELRLIIGNMFGNKTGGLILEVETLREFSKRREPDVDTRSGNGSIRDYHGKSMEALDVPASDPWVALKLVREKEAGTGVPSHPAARDIGLGQRPRAAASQPRDAPPASQCIAPPNQAPPR